MVLGDGCRSMRTLCNPLNIYNGGYYTIKIVKSEFIKQKKAPRGAFLTDYFIQIYEVYEQDF